MDVVVEHLLVSALPDGRALVRVEREPLAEGADPVAVGFSRVPDALSHSTSWRFEGGVVLLTFVHVLPDGRPLDGAWAGLPAELESMPVACHGVRHLHFLRHTDADVAAYEGIAGFWAFAAEVADQHYPAVAGLLAQHDLGRLDFSI
jgi:hypothetical protein